MSIPARWLGVLTSVVVGLGLLAAPAASDEPRPDDVAIGTEYDTSGPGQAYIVTLDDSVRVSEVVPGRALLDNLTGPAFRGAVAQLTAEQAAELRQQPGVVAVEKDREITAFGNDVTPDAVPAPGGWTAQTRRTCRWTATTARRPAARACTPTSSTAA